MIAPRVTMTLSARKEPTPVYPKPAPAVEKLTPAEEKRASVGEKTRETMIRETAYLYAERRGFEAGKELEDWLAAEREVDQLLTLRATQRR